MTTRDRITLSAALAVALASAALQPVYEDFGWLLPVLGGIVAVSGASALARLAGALRLLPPLAGLLALGAYTALVFAGQTLAYGLLPTPSTVSSLAGSFAAAMTDVQQLAPPVPTTSRLVLLAVLGTGAITVAVDTLAVGLRKAAVAGLPLLLLFAVPSAVLLGGLGVVPFAFAAAGWLGLLLADGSDRVARWGTPLRSAATSDDPGVGRVGRRIGAAALGVAAVVPVLVPGLDGRLLDAGLGDGLGGSRTTTTYNPLSALAGQLQRPTVQELFDYRSADGPDYLRLTTLDDFDVDDGWSSSELSADIDDDAVQDGVPVPIGRTTAAQTVEVEVDLTRRLDGPWLPVPATVSSVAIDGPWLWDEEAETVFSTRTSLREVDEDYLVRTARVRPDVALLRRTQTVPAKIAETYAQRPELSKEAQALLRKTTAGAPTAYDRVAALQDLFRGPSFTYSERTRKPPADAPDMLTAFLRTRQGFCEQYASAMAALVRGLGIPARVAVGFTAGSAIAADEYRVTTREAHAWPEVWFTGVGWVRFEPTPRDDDAGVDVPEYTIPPVEVDPTTTASAAPSVAPMAPGPAASTDPRALDRAGDTQGSSTPTGGTDDGLSRWWLAVPAALALLALPAGLSALRRRRRWQSPDALAAWASVQDDAVDVGHRWRPADSPRAAAAHLLASRHLPDDAAAALDRLATAAERARYARAAAPRDSAELRHDAKRVRGALQEAAAPRSRWLARLAPTSTVRWASTGLGTAVADLLDRFDLAVTAVGARLRHPRGRRAPG